MKFLLDTNFVMIPVQFKVDIYSELSEFGLPEIFVLDLVLQELSSLGKPGKLALEILQSHSPKILKSPGKITDNEILKAARSGFTVCTQDRILAKKLKLSGIPVITLRQKKYLVQK